MNIGIFEGGLTPLAPNIWARVIHYTINLYSHTIHKMQSTRRLGGEPGGATTYPDNPWWDLWIGFSDNRQALNRISLMRSSWITSISWADFMKTWLISISCLKAGDEISWWQAVLAATMTWDPLRLCRDLPLQQETRLKTITPFLAAMCYLGHFLNKSFFGPQTSDTYLRSRSPACNVDEW